MFLTTHDVHPVPTGVHLVSLSLDNFRVLFLPLYRTCWLEDMRTLSESAGGDEDGEGGRVGGLVRGTSGGDSSRAMRSGASATPWAVEPPCIRFPAPPTPSGAGLAAA